MKPNLNGNNTPNAGPDPIFLSSGQDGSAKPRPSHKPENRSPYPGINIGSAYELLDFRFEDTEILQEREE